MEMKRIRLDPTMKENAENMAKYMFVGITPEMAIGLDRTAGRGGDKDGKRKENHRKIQTYQKV